MTRSIHVHVVQSPCSLASHWKVVPEMVVCAWERWNAIVSSRMDVPISFAIVSSATLMSIAFISVRDVA